MASVPFWDENEDGYTGQTYPSNEWDTLLIGGYQTPGVCEVQASFALAYNKSKPSGSHGARITFTGRDPQEVDVTLYLWTPDQWEAWQGLQKIICGSDRKQPECFDVYHPALAMLGIKSVAVVSRSAPMQGRVKGERSIRLRLVEWSPPPAKARAKAKPATKTMEASVNESFKTDPQSQYTPPDANISLPSGESATVNP